MNRPRVAVVFGSDSDWSVMARCVEELRSFHEEPYVEVMSAHRNPERVHAFSRGAEGEGLQVIVAAAGMSNALAGAIAAQTALPVIAVPLVSGSLQGLDALLSSVQMPPGVPVAVVSVGEPGARNAAILAIQILARHDDALALALRKFKTQLAGEVAERNRRLQAQRGT